MKKILLLAIMAISALTISAQLPNVKLQDINGKTVQTGTISNNGKPIIISFWATWCKPCLRELKAIHEVYPDWQEETGVKMLYKMSQQKHNMNMVETTEGIMMSLIDRLESEKTFVNHLDLGKAVIL